MSFAEDRRRIVGQDENIELGRTKVVAIDRRKVVQFLDQPILKSYEVVEIRYRVRCELQNQLIFHSLEP
jgi:hypothetical protein